MSLHEKLGGSIKSAMLARDADRLGTLRLLKSALGYAAIEKKKDVLDDAEFIAVVQKEVKKRRDAMEQYQSGGRPELAAKEKTELAVLEEFLPAALSAAELEALVKSCIQETGATSKKDMGNVIRAVQAKAAGRAEGKVISQLVGSLLS
ncbi:MAG TPA: glutamyl-tRNA amidotransferase [Verrucomicrobiales bacterium]|nr:glutamyl-tRNA amidotransferase [Verrucomicrobiales bacterium]